MDAESSIRAADGVPLDVAWHVEAARQPRGVIVQVHGINADMHEGGMFRRLADQLASEGFGVLRVSFRGHGLSGGSQRGATIAGEMLDLQAAVESAIRRSTSRCQLSRRVSGPCRPACPWAIWSHD